MSENPLTPEQLQALVQYASRQLGTTPEKLLQSVRSGGAEQWAQTLPPEERERLNRCVGGEENARKLLDSPTVRQLIRQLLSEAGN